MSTVHAVGEDTAGRSDNDGTDDLGLGAAEGPLGWWCGEEGMGSSHFVAPKMVLYYVSEGVTLLEELIHTTKPFYDR